MRASLRTGIVILSPSSSDDACGLLARALVDAIEVAAHLVIAFCERTQTSLAFGAPFGCGFFIDTYDNHPATRALH